MNFCPVAGRFYQSTATAIDAVLNITRQQTTSYQSATSCSKLLLTANHPRTRATNYMFFMPLVQIFQDTRNFTRTTFVSNTIYSLHCCLSRIISYVKCHKYLTFYLLLWGELRWLKAKGKRQAWCLLQVKLYDPCLSTLKWFVYHARRYTSARLYLYLYVQR